MTVCAILAAVVIGTWNGNWFPSGRAEHRAHPLIEDATVVAVADMLRQGLAQADPAGTNDVILCLQEMRGPKVVSNLVARIGRKGLKVAVVSGYRRRDRFDQQQDAIVTTLPVTEAGWRKWSSSGEETPPRGYAFASVVVDPATTARVCSVHLKSNYRAGTDDVRRLNRAKRSRAIEELLRCERNKYQVVAGDFNADKWRTEFAEETLFDSFSAAGFANLLEMLPPKVRGTHPSRTYGDSAFDYIMVRGFSVPCAPLIIYSQELSDHWAVYGIICGN